MTSKSIAQELGKTGFCVCPNFLSAKFTERLKGEIDRHWEAKHFKIAGTGLGRSRLEGLSTRQDQICWLEREPCSRSESQLWRRIDVLRIALNRSLFLGLTQFEGHYALYPAGGLYQRHRDSFLENSNRMVSIVLYLNPSWQTKDGGQLRLFSEDHSFLDISPNGGTLACFFSREAEHEVLVSHALRYSFVGWFKVAS